MILCFLVMLNLVSERVFAEGDLDISMCQCFGLKNDENGKAICLEVTGFFLKVRGCIYGNISKITTGDGAIYYHTKDVECSCLSFSKVTTIRSGSIVGICTNGSIELSDVTDAQCEKFAGIQLASCHKVDCFNSSKNSASVWGN